MAVKTKAQLEDEILALHKERENLIEFIKNYRQGTLECRRQFLVESGLLKRTPANIQISFNISLEDIEDFKVVYDTVPERYIQTFVEDAISDCFEDVAYDVGVITVRVVE